MRRIGYASLSKMYPHLYFLHNKIWMSNSRSLDNYIQGLHERCLRFEAFKLSKIICSRQIYFCQHLFCTVAIKVSKRYCTRNIPGHFLKSHKSHRTSEKTSVFNAAEIIFFHQILLDTTFSIKAVVQRYSEKTVFLQISQNSQENTWPRYFPVNFMKFLRAPSFIEHLRWLLLFQQK